MFNKIKNLYTSFKPLLVFLISFNVCLLFKNSLSQNGPFVDKDNNLDFWIGFFVLFISVISIGIEDYVTKNATIINIEIIDENKMRGNTPLYLDEKQSYKIIYIRIDITKMKKNFIDSSDSIKVKFPIGVSVNLLNYENLFTTDDNEILFNLKKNGVNQNGVRLIPVNIKLVTEKKGEIDGASIEITECFKNKKIRNRILTEVNKCETKITVKRDD
ncbi:hypothetical protein K4Q04_08690 [Staphylococcus epidermidis]|uniref:hypothetical protein n=1 Tax=Staphylococcus epidermidis TaxID=1282 RepID=UPI001932E36E|nr:hypothetical protein [Staphylococcus epidermidis]MBM0775521.1 hypothetical protein [Staphylococcus epidermidis]MCG1077958.1 hypothetical protein [Staphylococcus epidermidis]MCG1150985.1 hypothetical protein [Staphylococcus epidermidis]MCG1152859.1 hypothetical protein [Staphylococcus epidermidis]MCG1256263.1 hypothetical protein [Staphylococcus epidermidis]